MKQRTNYMMSRWMFITAFALLCGRISAYAESLTEDFENVVLVDKNGEALASSMSFGNGLSNGWKIVNGSIYASEGTTDYGLVSSNGYESDHCLEASYGATNSAFVALPEKLEGTLSFYAAGTATSVDGKITVYEITEDGDSYVKGEVIATVAPTRYNKSLKSYVWNQYSIELGIEGRLIGIEMVRSRLDDFTAETAGSGNDTPVDPELTVSTSLLVFGLTDEAKTETITVQSNVATAVSFAITGDGASAFELVDAPATLQKNTVTSINVRFDALAPGDYSATLTITAGELTKKVTLAATWQEKELSDPSDWTAEDFTGLSEIPEGWTNDGWEIDDWWLDTAPALKGQGTLITPWFSISEAQVLQYYFQKGLSYSWNSSFAVEYTSDNTHWTRVEALSFQGSGYDMPDGVNTINFPGEGNYRVRFIANTTTYLDNFEVVTSETTGIRSLTVDNGSQDVMYNLNGQRLTGAKGIVVIKGKKLILK